MISIFVGLNIFIFIQHAVFFILETVLWKAPTGLRIFRMTETQASQTYTLAINQGFYNLFFSFGFLMCATLFLGFGQGDHKILYLFNLYLALSIVGAAVVGGATVSSRILLIQGIPSLILSVVILYDLLKFY
jgi:putative membrane protein